MTDINELNEALNPATYSFENVAKKQRAIQEAAQQYAKLLPLINELCEARGNAPKGVWEWWNGCSWWRLGVAGRGDNPILEPYNSSTDGHRDISAKPGVKEFITKAANLTTEIIKLRSEK